MTVRALNPRIERQQPEQMRDGAVAPASATLGIRGATRVRLAAGGHDIEASQALRYRVFYEELGAEPDDRMLTVRRDADAYDAICEHLLVIAPPGASGERDPILADDGEVVGTYRLLRQDVAERNGGFYTADEFDIAPLLARHGGRLSFLELGRSCVLRPFRTRPVIEMLWQGIWNYVRLYRFDVMFGCASLVGTDPDRLARELSFLHHYFRAPPEWRVRAVQGRYHDMNRLPADAIDDREAMRALPALIKGYLRLGAHIGEGAVVDHQFNTTDILIVLPVSAIKERYFQHFGGPGTCSSR